MSFDAVTFSYRMPNYQFWISNVLFCGLGTGGLLVTLTRDPINILMIVLAGFLTLVWVILLPVNIWSEFKSPKELIVEDDNIKIPSYKNRGLKETSYSEVQEVLQTYKAGIEVIQAKLILNSGKKHVIVKAWFKSDQAFEECVTLIHERVEAFHDNIL